MVHVHCVIMMTVLFLVEASAQCHHGEVRLVNGCVPNEGRVEVCACIARSCSWGTVCDDRWGERDAQVVCRQLGCRPDGAMAFSRAQFGQGQGNILLDNVNCNGGESTLFECDHLVDHNCVHSEDAGVRCTGCADSSLLSINVNTASIIRTQDINLYTVLITWKLLNKISWYQPNSYQIECFSDQHRIEMSVNNASFSVQLMGLLPSTSYNCCVSAVYVSCIANGVCTETANIPPSETSVIQPGTCITTGMASSSADTIIGGVLGFIIAILLILLAISGASLVYLLRQRFPRNVIPKVSVDRNSTEVPVRRNLSYAITPSHSTTSGSQAAQATRAADQSESEAAADYSIIGPSYETTDSRRQQPAVAITGRNQVSMRLSERYEFSEAHLAAAGDDGGGQGEATMDYEVPQNLSMRQIIEEHEEYSHLQH